MRIISGHLKGILITPPKGLPVRPTTDRAKESLFNILENNFTFDQLNTLDLFSGTGNIAYEFFSRGVNNVTAVDINHKCVEFIKSMKQQHQMQVLEVVKKDAFSYLKSTPHTYHIIFADAPYAHRDIYQIPRLVSERNLLMPNGWLVVEHENMLDLSQEPQFMQKREYGHSCFSFFSSKPHAQTL